MGRPYAATAPPRAVTRGHRISDGDRCAPHACPSAPGCPVQAVRTCQVARVRNVALMRPRATGRCARGAGHYIVPMTIDRGAQPLTGGSVNPVVRIGDTVRRPTGPWTAAVHALLRHLERRGFTAAPRVLGIDDAGREMLTYLDGSAALRPWPDAFLRTSGMTALGRMLGAYHHAVADFRPPPDAT